MKSVLAKRYLLKKLLSEKRNYVSLPPDRGSIWFSVASLPNLSGFDRGASLINVYRMKMQLALQKVTALLD